MKRIAGFALSLLLAACGSSSSSGAPADAGDDADAEPPLDLAPWMPEAHVFVDGHAADNTFLDCRTVICRHNENTDMIVYQGAIFLVHRTALSQVLGPNSALHVYKSTDSGKTFVETARIPAPSDRDLRDPCFYVAGGELFIKALTRLPVSSARDSDVDTVSVGMHSKDGVTWTPMQDIGPHGWSFWRVKENAGVYYTAAYQDGDKSVVLYTSNDGLAWTAGPVIYDVAADTPLETELQLMPSGKLLALVRTDGTDQELLGDEGRLRTQVCWSSPPYASFSCPQTFDGERLDGPLSFMVNGRLFVIARRHLQAERKKRTALFEITGDFDGGPLAIAERGDLPSAGDTSYAGIAMTDPTHAVVSWYSGDRAQDRPWVVAIFDLTDVWLGTIDFSKL